MKKLSAKQRNSLLDHVAMKIRFMDPKEITGLSIPANLVPAVKRDLHRIADLLISHIDTSEIKRKPECHCNVEPCACQR